MGAIIAIPVTVALYILPKDLIQWLKWGTAHVYIERNKKKKRFDLYDMETDNDPVKTNFISPQEERELESPLSDAQLFETSDVVYFYGVNSKSECIFIRLSREQNQEAQAWIYVRMKDGKVYYLKETGFQQSVSDKRAFTCGALQMQYLSPMRRWRIFFNGLLSEEKQDDSQFEEKVHVKFALLWHASSDVFDFNSDISTKTLANVFAKSNWQSFHPPIEKLYGVLDKYAQCGTLIGFININGEQQNVHLFGEKLRYLGDMSSQCGIEFVHIFGQTLKNGRFVHIVNVSFKDVVRNLNIGFIIQPTGNLVEAFFESGFIEKVENRVMANFHAAGKLYELEGTLGKPDHFQDKETDNSWTMACLDFKINSLEGKGIVLKGEILRPKQRISPRIEEKLPSVIPLVVHFSEKLCQETNITGGKGSSLGKLTELSKEFQNFIVPNGIVVTTAAYEMFITKEVLKEIRVLEDVLYGNSDGDVKIACEKVKEEIIKSNVPNQVLQAIVINIEKAFSTEKSESKFAVRSSATGEDTEQLSAAGQMDTFLGVTGINEIISAVKKCWASQFGYIAVEYKRQNGQIINSPMAVVIQKMVPCDVAGVLFTCDPLTGNPTVISITANYGLGESVVSGSQEPDTIEIERCSDDTLVIKNKIIGSKNQRIIIKDGEGTIEEDVSESERQICCLTDDMILRLSYLAIKIENSYRSQRDIEWGFWNDNLYIFQSRPITSTTGETDFEIDHEMDGAFRVENEYFSVCNVGEVMPGAMSTLGHEVVLKFFNIVFQRKNFVDWQMSSRSRYYAIGMVTMYSRVMFQALNLFQRVHFDPGAVESASIALFGRKIDDEEIITMARERFAEERNGDSLKSMFKRFLRVFYIAERRLKRGQEQYANYHLSFNKYKTSPELFKYLLETCTDLCEAMACHMVCSESSSIWNSVLFAILRAAKGGIHNDVYSDFALLLTTNSEVESADVPSALESLAFQISQDIKPEEFKSMETSEALRILETSTSISGNKYREFIRRHGHRCLKEFDIRSVTWASDQDSLIKLLQKLVGNVKKDRSKKELQDFKKLESKLNVPLNFKSRTLLKFLLPRSRRAVQNREASKSIVIRGLDEWRKGYAQLAKLMVSEGRIPNGDLLYFMSLEEIEELLSSRSPKIISKANHRRRRYPILDKYIFPEIMKGFPKPINAENTKRQIVANGDNFTMTGIPVSQGTAEGYIRVALNVEEASSLKPGEILVAYSTDIGWSPYFPMLKGVVTELGGLISHGAVVSREYGIPCVAGLHGATNQFQTGDYVYLDGNKGILQKLPPPKNEASEE